MDLSKFFEKILTELSYRVKEGIPDLTNETHVAILKQILLEETDYNYSLVDEILNNINKKELKKVSTLVLEAEKKEKAPVPAPEPAPTADKKGKKAAPAPAPADDTGKKAPKPVAPDSGEEDAPAPGGEDAPASGADEKGGGGAPAPTPSPTGADAGGEEAGAEDEENPEKEPKEKETEKPDKPSNQATINMQNAEQSGVYFSRPNTQYAASPAVEAIYEHPDGGLFMKIGDSEFQINICPYTGYRAAIQLQPLKKEPAKETGEYIKVAPNHKTDVKPEGGTEEK